MPRYNNIAASDNSKFRGDPWAALDRLPQPLRWAIHEGIVVWDPREDRWWLDKLMQDGMPEDKAVARLLTWHRESNEYEIEKFGMALPSVFGGASPHMFAEATIQPYGERTPAIAAPAGRCRSHGRGAKARR